MLWVVAWLAVAPVVADAGGDRVDDHLERRLVLARRSASTLAFPLASTDGLSLAAMNCTRVPVSRRKGTSILQTVDARAICAGFSDGPRRAEAPAATRYVGHGCPTLVRLRVYSIRKVQVLPRHALSGL